MSFRYSAVALITWDLSWYWPNDAMYRSYFIFDVNEVQKEGSNEFFCESFMVKYVFYPPFYPIFPIGISNCQWWILNINLTQKNKITTWIYGLK